MGRSEMSQDMTALVTTRLNNADLAMLDATDHHGGGGESAIAGYEAAGVIDAVGPGVDETLIGARIATATPRAFAQDVLADHRHILMVPDTVSFEEAAALPTALLTEHGAMRAGALMPGQTVLVTGATSAIGLIGVQVARELGASRIIATTRSKARADLLRDCGADTIIQTTSTDLADAVLGVTDGNGVDLVLDHVGGQVFAHALAATRRHGIVVQIGRLDQTRPTINLDLIAYRRLTVRGVSFGEPDEIADLLAEAGRQLLPAVAAGRIKRVIDSVLPFDRATEAIDRMRQGLARGKVVHQVP